MEYSDKFYDLVSVNYKKYNIKIQINSSKEKQENEGLRKWQMNT